MRDTKRENVKKKISLPFYTDIYFIRSAQCNTGSMTFVFE